RYSESDEGREENPDQLGCVKQPACRHERSAVQCGQRQECSCRASSEPIARRGSEADPERHPRLQQDPRHVRVPASVRAVYGSHAAAGGVRYVLPRSGKSLRNDSASGRRWIGSEVESPAVEVHLLVIKASAWRIYVSGDSPGPNFAKGGVLASAGDVDPLTN